MADRKYTSTFIRRLDNRAGRPWQGILRYSEPNPDYIPCPDGAEDTRTDKQRRRTISRQVTKVFDSTEVKTKSQANEALEKWRAEMEAAAREPDLARVSVADYVDAFLDGANMSALLSGREAGGGVRTGNSCTMSNGRVVEASTMKGYRSAAKHIREGLGDIDMHNLTSDDVTAWLVGLRACGYSLSVQGKDYRLLNMVCRHAVKKHHIQRNPCEDVAAPKQPKASPNALTDEHRARLLEELGRCEATPLVTSAYIALYMGLREGEICGLRWKDVDLSRRIMRVSHAIGQSESGTYEKATKNDASTRTLSIPAPLADKLAARRTRMTGELAEAGVVLSTDEFAALFVVGTIDGRYKNPNQLGKEWHVLAEAHGLLGTKGRTVTFHDLRHTFATVAVEQGVDIKSVSSFLGHTNAAMTLNTYASANPNAIAAAAESVGMAM